MTTSPARKSPANGIAVVTFNQVPAVNLTFKYEVLGRMAIENHRSYCDRHGYRFIDKVPIASDRPACWAKIPALLDALETHAWALWSDSDTLILAPERPIETFCDPDYDLIVQSHEEFFDFIGMPREEGLRRMPINSGVFLARSTTWCRDFLRRAYEATEFVSNGEVWDGVGEQEAMIALLKRNPGDLARIKCVTGLQNHPRFYRPGDVFVHFYGNYAKHRIPLTECDEVFGRWEAALRHRQPFPADRARFHWCCIQNKLANSPVVRGDLPRYLYALDDIELLPSQRR